jgi:uroporphyrinogen-III synthase
MKAKVSLAKRTIAITHASRTKDALAEELRALGAEVIAAPAIAVGPPESYEGLDAALHRLGNYAWIAFASANAVEHTLARLAELNIDKAQLAKARLAAVGPATAHALEEAGLPVALMAERATGVGLAEALAPDVYGVNVLLPRAEEGRTELADALEASGARVTSVAAYATKAVPRTELAELEGALGAGKVDALTMASPSAVDSLCEGVGAPLLKRVALAAIGPTTKAAAEAKGLTVALCVEGPLESLAGALAAHFSTR